MTDYPAGNTRRQSWKKREVQKKWQSLLAIVIVLIFALAIINGLSKVISVKKYFGDSSWDNKSSFALALGTDSPTLFIFQKDPARIVYLALSSQTFLPTGDASEPITDASRIIESQDGQKLASALSLSFRSNIENYLIFKNSQKINGEIAQKLFKNFASLTTPVTILTGGYNTDHLETNITRIDQFKLWWQIKGISIESLDFVDIGQVTEEILQKNGQRVQGVDETGLHREITKYLENLQIRKENLKIEIENASSITGAGNLASDFVTSVGGNVVKVESVDSKVQKTNITSSNKSKYTSRYLAKMFKSDINSPLGGEADSGEDQIKIIIGDDFAARYFE